MFKKTIKVLLVFILVLGFTGGGSKRNDGKVKVYIFEAGGCPYCEAQKDYLKSLEGYDKTFEIVEKELYIDHISWEKGKDYDLGVKVAKAFNDAGFDQASYQGTPFVVISDVYAKASYSAELEEVIKQVKEEGDNDTVACLEKNPTDKCDIRENLTPTDKKINDVRNNNLINYIIIYALIGAIIVYLFLTRNKCEKKVVVKEFKNEEKPRNNFVNEYKPQERLTENKPQRKVPTTKPKNTTKKPTKKKN
jgi:glutaredoxin